ncbi:MAG: helix-hairpin-helix domain-containing protein, partial [Clostridiales bacterium]|nr:helix-hairpin-helix domain-containing protein [Clostridiales bacterium]
MAGETVLEGTVETIIYQNEENGYTVLRLDTGENLTTVVGCMPGAAPGESLAIQGNWVRHASYGEQFRAEVVQRRMPRGEQAIFDYLASGAVKGIGAATARRLVEEFGADALDVLEQEPERLTRIKGITRKRALAMGEAFHLQMGMRRLLDFLTGHGLPPQLGMPLYRRYGDRALEAVRDNPYLLTEGELAVSFAQADSLALELGTDLSDPRRVEAGILFELRHNLDNGHTFLPRGKLLAATQMLIGVDDGTVLDSGLSALEAQGRVTEDFVAGEDACYLSEFYDAEALVAERIGTMSANELCPLADLDRLISRIEKTQGLTYAPQQRLAVELAAKRQVMLLTGGPGTGKTTSLRGVLALFDDLGLET